MLPVTQFQEFINEKKLFSTGNKILLAVSGGKDSVLMVHLFKAVGIDVGVAHCNFNLRGEEAQRDELFVKMLANSLGLPFYVTHFETKRYAAENKISTQMAARNLRYKWFEELRVKEEYDYIALAQHQNDAVETVLINLIRGTGISGLHGILPKRGSLIRPLLFLNRAEINRFVEDNKLSYVEDSSNLSTHYIRNKLRLQVIPHLQEINSNLEKTFAENISRFADIESFLALQISALAGELLSKKGDGIYISLSDIAKLAPQKLLFFELMKPYGFTSEVVDAILAAEHSLTGKHFYSASHQAIINRENLIIVERNSGETTNRFVHPSSSLIEFGAHLIKLEITDEVTFSASKEKAFIDAGKLIFPLVIRNWQRGDKFFPLGMKTPKKISDFFIDEKIPLHLKASTPIVVNGNAEVIWIAGMRQDNRYKLTAGTKKVVIFELKKK